MSRYLPLDGCVAKLNRATHQMRELAADIQRYGQERGYRVALEDDPRTQERVFRVHVREPPRLMEWGVMVGDIVHNLRSALDHLIEQLTILNVGTSYKQTEFPIFADRDRFFAFKKNGLPNERDATSGLYKIRGLAPCDQAAVERLQPYHRQNGVLSHPLLLLHKLNNIDKHQVVPVVTLTFVSHSMGIGGPGQAVEFSMEIGPHLFQASTPVEDQAEVGRLKFQIHRASDPEVQVNWDYATDVSFEEGGVGQGRKVAEALREAQACVLGIVSQFSPRWLGKV